MPEITEEDAMNIVRDYYSQDMKPDSESVIRIVAILSKLGIAGLVIYAFDQGVRASEASHQGSMKGG